DTCAYHEVFKKEKLIWMDLTEQGRFIYDIDGMFCLNTAFVMSGQSIKYLCALLNSKLITWFMGNTALNSGMGVTRWINASVATIPIPKIPTAQQRPFIRLVDHILTAKATDPDADVSTTEAEIDLRVCELYGLKAKESSAVEEWLLP
ncbi:MAG: class I SAM-dependent DNA methyltransferase, partial [Gemmatimonadetes bacterium]|nr:class I SAM-dependent DNA methyltransferase [Gemmatimonadota bacterium]